MPSLYETTPETGTVSSANSTSLYSNTTDFTTGVVTSAVSSVNAGTGVTVNPTTGNVVVSIGQSVATTANPVFAGATLGNVTVGVASNNTITTLTGPLILESATNEIDTGDTSILSTNSGSFFLLNSPTTVNAFQGATTLDIGAITGTTTINNNLTIDGTNINLAQATDIVYNENNNRTYRPTVISSTGNSSGFRVSAPNAGSSTSSTLSVNNSNDSANTEFLAIQARGSSFSDTFRFFSGKYIANVLNATNKSVAFVDNTNTYATVNPSGPTIGTDLTTKTYVDTVVAGSVTSIIGTTNQVIASNPTGAVTLSLPQSIGTGNTPTFAGATLGNVTVGVSTDNTITTTSGDLTLDAFTNIVKVDANLTITGADVNLAQGTTFKYDESNNRANRPEIQSTTGNSSGFRILAPNATTSANSSLNLFGSNDLDNGSFMGIATSGSTTAPFSIRSGAYTASVFGASGKSINIIDGSTTYASLNPAGPTIGTDLTTKSYVDAIPNITYTIDATSTTGGANFNLTGSDASVDSIKFASGTNVTVSRTDANTITIASTDTNTTYDFAASSTTGGANLNLVGSDSTTDTVKLTNGGHITATYTTATEVTLGSTATSANTASAIVARDGSGNFSAGTITAALSGNATTATTAAQVANSLTAGTHLSGGPFNGSAAVTLTTDATDVNTAGTIVSRDGSGNFSASGATLGAVTVGVDTDQTVSTSSGNLVLQTAAGVNAGTVTLTAGANGVITVAPNGTGNVTTTFSNGGNLTNNRNYVFGAIRNATTQTTNGDIWELNTSAAQSATNPYFRGVSLDNSADTTRGPATLMRSYSGSAGANGSAQRGRVVFEKARGTAASPSAVQANDILGSVDVSGYSSTGWINDTIGVVPAFFGFAATENWVSNTALGSNFTLTIAPSATTISSAANLIQCLNINPQTFTQRSDAFTWTNGKTGTTQTLALDVSGNLTVTGDVRINGNDIQCSSGASTITMTSANTATTIRGDTINLQTSASVGIVGSSNISYNRVYGQWQYDATITPAGANTAYAFPWAGTNAVTDYANIASATNTSRIQPNATGFYNLQFSIQLQNTDNAADHTAYFWWRRNGTDIVASMGRVYVTKANQTISAWNNIVQATASTDYFELMYAVDNVALVFPYFAATAFGPATAASFVSITPVGA